MAGKGAWATVDIDLNKAAIMKLIVRTSADLSKTGAQSVQARARRLAPTKTGKLRESIMIHPIRIGVVSVYQVGSDLDYAAYQEFGTGPIHARKGGALVWTDGGKVIFAKRTRGVPATRFMEKAAARITIADFV